MSDDITIKGLNRLAYQFENSLKFQEFLTAFLAESDELNDSALLLLTNRYLDTAEGIQLDGIGEIVGLPRPKIDLAVVGLFGFVNDPTSLGFSSTLDPTQGGHFWDGTPDQVLVGDDQYRLLLRAKIIENQISMTVDETLTLISSIFDTTVRYFLQVNLHPKYEIHKLLDDFEINLALNLPILIGLGAVTYVSVPETDPFGFVGDTGALGFSDTSNPTIGGNFSKTV